MAAIPWSTSTRTRSCKQKTRLNLIDSYLILRAERPLRHWTVLKVLRSWLKTQISTSETKRIVFSVRISEKANHQLEWASNYPLASLRVWKAILVSSAKIRALWTSWAQLASSLIISRRVPFLARVWVTATLDGMPVLRARVNRLQEASFRWVCLRSALKTTTELSRKWVSVSLAMKEFRCIAVKTKDRMCWSRSTSKRPITSDYWPRTAKVEAKPILSLSRHQSSPRVLWKRRTMLQ